MFRKHCYAIRKHKRAIKPIEAFEIDIRIINAVKIAPFCLPWFFENATVDRRYDYSETWTVQISRVAATVAQNIVRRFVCPPWWKKGEIIDGTIRIP
jgi:hypothetical protein